MHRAEFLRNLDETEPAELVASWLESHEVAACSGTPDYDKFRSHVREYYPQSTAVYIVGSANWRYSLNPKKQFRAFGRASDVDVATISTVDFGKSWNALRDFHRRRFYQLSGEARQRLRRNGENVYAGFVSPEWIPDRANTLRYDFIRSLQRLSTPLVGNLPVRMLFFRNEDEVVDYYRRGVMLAKAELTRWNTM